MSFLSPTHSFIKYLQPKKGGKKKAKVQANVKYQGKRVIANAAKIGNREYLRPTPVFPAPPTQAPLLLDIIATQVCIRVSHLLVVVVRTLYDTVDCLTPSAVASRPVPQIGIGFSFRLQPKKVTLRRRGEFEDEDTAGCARSVRGKCCFRGEDD